MGDSWQPGRSQSGSEKKIICVTMRRRNLGVRNGLGRKFSSSTALLLILSVPGFDIGILAPLSLAPRRLPAVNQPEALRVLAVALHAGSRPVLATATLAQATS